MKSLDKRRVIAQCLVIVCAMVAIGVVSTRAQDPTAGPAVGDTIDLLSFRSQKGETLAEATKGHSLAMILLVNPNCQTCTSSKDGLKSLKDRMARPGIPYFIVMVPNSSEAEKYFSYADSLNLEAQSFVWSSAGSKPPASLVNMTVPSHILLTKEGRVVDKWPGKVEP